MVGYLLGGDVEKGNFGGHFIQAHSIWKVDHTGDKLTLTPISQEWLKAGIKDGTLKVKHEEMGREKIIVLTASTEELQKFVLKHASNPRVFAGGLELRRVINTGKKSD